MNKKIDYECYKRIIQGTYKKFTLMEKNNWTKATTINEIVKLIQEEVRNVDKKNKTL